jgi:hypothetical protein
MTGRNKSGARRIAQGVAVAMLLTGCQMQSGSATETTICRELARDLPTYSRSDTPQTLASGAQFVAVFNAICKS